MHPQVKCRNGTENYGHFYTLKMHRKQFLAETRMTMNVQTFSYQSFFEVHSNLKFRKLPNNANLDTMLAHQKPKTPVAITVAVAVST